jgi:D-tyrosyl-tRNA(Tyr) deacylase
VRSVVQRVSRAEVRVEGVVRAAIGHGLVALVGIERRDTDADRSWTAGKIANLRVFEDGDGKMNRSVLESGAEVLLIPNFTVPGDCRKGRRPSFDNAMAPEHASAVFDGLAAELRGLGVAVGVGVFRAHMQVELVNDGPITLVIESPG